MASGLRDRDETKPRRFDLTMSRRTRRPPAATSATGCHEQDHHLAVDVDVDVEELGFQPAVVIQKQEPEQQDPDGLLCLSDHLQSRQPELDAHHRGHDTDTSEQRSEDTTQEQQASPPQTADESEEQQQHQQEDEECQDNSRRFSLQELIEDEAVDAATAALGGGGGVREVVAEGAAAAGAEKRPGQQVAGRRVIIGIMRRYVKVPSIKPKRASPEKNTTPVC